MVKYFSLTYHYQFKDITFEIMKKQLINNHVKYICDFELNIYNFKKQFRFFLILLQFRAIIIFYLTPKVDQL